MIMHFFPDTVRKTRTLTEARKPCSDTAANMGTPLAIFFFAAGFFFKKIEAMSDELFNIMLLICFSRY